MTSLVNNLLGSNSNNNVINKENCIEAEHNKKISNTALTCIDNTNHSTSNDIFKDKALKDIIQLLSEGEKYTLPVSIGVDKIPLEIFQHILSFLNPRDLLVASRVNKTFFSIMYSFCVFSDFKFKINFKEISEDACNFISNLFRLSNNESKNDKIKKHILSWFPIEFPIGNCQTERKITSKWFQEINAIAYNIFEINSSREVEEVWKNLQNLIFVSGILNNNLLKILINSPFKNIIHDSSDILYWAAKYGNEKCINMLLDCKEINLGNINDVVDQAISRRLFNVLKKIFTEERFISLPLRVSPFNSDAPKDFVKNLMDQLSDLEFIDKILNNIETINYISFILKHLNNFSLDKLLIREINILKTHYDLKESIASNIEDKDMPALLYDCISKNKLDQLAQLLYVPVSNFNLYGQKALSRLIYKKNSEEIFKLLSEHNILIDYEKIQIEIFHDKIKNDDCFVLMWAAKHSSEKAIEMLLDDERINLTQINHVFALVSERKLINILTKILKDQKFYSNLDFYSALGVAFSDGHVKIAKLLLDIIDHFPKAREILLNKLDLNSAIRDYSLIRLITQNYDENSSLLSEYGIELSQDHILAD